MVQVFFVLFFSFFLRTHALWACQGEPCDLPHCTFVQSQIPGNLATNLGNLRDLEEGFSSSLALASPSESPPLGDLLHLLIPRNFVASEPRETLHNCLQAFLADQYEILLEKLKREYHQQLEAIAQVLRIRKKLGNTQTG